LIYGETRQGRERYCELKPGKLKEVDEWISYYRTFWTKKFTSLKNYIAKENLSQPKKNKINGGKRRKEPRKGS